MSSAAIDVLAFVNAAREACGLQTLSGITVAGCERASQTDCLLARALECEVRGVDWGEDRLSFSLCFADALVAELVGRATGRPHRGRQVLPPDELVDVIVSFDFGCVVSDRNGMLIAWAVPADPYADQVDWVWFGPDGRETLPAEVPDDVRRSLRRATERHCGPVPQAVAA